METNMVTKKNKLTVYGCGGAGTNIAQILINHPVSSEDGKADIQAFIIDTSHSNLLAITDRNAFYHIEGADGSGKVRKENYDKIERQIRNVLLKFEPTDINVVISSASGGSGCVISSLLIQELVQQGHPVVGLIITDDDCLLSAENSYKTLVSLNNMAKKSNMPYVVKLFSNQNRSQTDQEISKTIEYLSCLFSNEHLELDNTDLFNFLHYERTQSIPPSLIHLDIATDLADVTCTSPVTLALLHNGLDAQEKTRDKFSTQYRCEGFIRNDSHDDLSIIFYTDFAPITKQIDQLNQSIDKFKKSLEAATQRGLNLSVSNAEEVDTGMVF